jgi:hypothetical protein
MGVSAILRVRALSGLATAGVILSLSVGVAYADVNSARAAGLAWLIQNQNGDGSWGSVSGLKVTATSAGINAFLQSGIQRGLWYSNAVAFLANASPASIDGRARQLATLYRVGRDTSKLSSSLQSAGGAASAGYSWGTLPGYATSLADSSLATSALMATVSGYSGWQFTLCNVFVPYQRSSGGWSYLGEGNNSPTSASTASVIPTALTIMALEQIAALGVSTFSCGSTYSMSTIIGNGVNFLLANQNADHGFGDNGTSGALETALAYIAIQTFNPSNSALAPAQSYLLAQQLSNGSWENDGLQTALVLQSFPVTTLPDADGDGIPDVVAALLHIPSNGTGGRGLVASNGQAVSGTTDARFVGEAVIGSAFRVVLPTPAGGTGPFTYKLVSGSLPTGLTLASNGTVSGTSSIAGVFNFTYQVTDANQNTTTAVAQITAESESTADAPLPEWSAIVLGTVLLFLGERRSRRLAGASGTGGGARPA